MQTATTSSRRRLLAVTLAVGLLATACGSSDDAATDTQPANTKSSSDTVATETPEDPPEASSSDDALLRVRETSQGALLETGDGQTVYGNLDDVLQDTIGCPDKGPDWCGDFVPLLSPSGDVASDGLDPAEYIIVDNPLGAQLALASSVEDGVPLYTYSSEGPGEYTGQDFGSSWYPMGALGKMNNSFDPDLE